MFCTKCGASIPDGAPFCGNCGAPVDQGNTNAQQPDMQPQMNMQQPDMQQPDMQPQMNMQMPAFNPAVLGQTVVNNFNTKKLNLISLIALIVAFFSTFLPFIKVDVLFYSESISLAKTADGKLIIIAIILGIVFSCLGINLGTAITAGLSFLVLLIDVGNINDELGNSGFVDLTVGFYFVLICIIVAFVGAIYRIIKNKNNNNAYMNNQNNMPPYNM